MIKLLSRWHTCEKLFQVYQQRKETVCSIFISVLADGVLKFINLIEQLKTVVESSYSNAMSCNIITSLSDIFNITKIKFEKLCNLLLREGFINCAMYFLDCYI